MLRGIWATPSATDETPSVNKNNGPTNERGATLRVPRGTHKAGQRYREWSRGLTLIELVVVLVILISVGGLLVPLLTQRSIQIDLDGPGGNDGKLMQQVATETTLARVAEAIDGAGGYAQAMRYARDPGGTDGADDRIGEGTGLPWPSDADIDAGRADHPQLVFLFEPPTGLADYDPVTKIGWRDSWLSFATAGSYLLSVGENFTDVYGVADDPAPIDAWGSPIVIQLPVATAGTFDQRVNAVRLVSAGEDLEIDTPADELFPADIDDDVVLYLRTENP